MKSKAFSKMLIGIEKLAYRSQEDIDFEAFSNIQRKDLVVIQEPFPHIIIENFFKPEIYTALCEEFDQIRSRGLSKEKVNWEKFHAFDVEYEGYVYLPPGTLDPQNPLSIFFSLEWNRFFSKLFHQFTSFETTLAFHHHPAGDQTSIIHHDFSDRRFFSGEKLQNGVIYKYGSDNPKNHTRRRVISILFYLNNSQWHEGDGGETGIYSADKKTLLKVVPPINNRIFAFQTSPRSMHAFQSNKTERNSFVQWFHIPPELL